MNVIKASGEAEPFMEEKLVRSLKNAGSSPELIDSIVKEINKFIYPGITTRRIYKRAFELLRKDSESHAVKYQLKQSFFELGFSGYPFETLIGEIFSRQGYSCEVGLTLNGQCITHEMDVVATKKQEQHLVECKYRLDQGKSISIQVPLYVHSRVNDIAKEQQKSPEYQHFTFQPWVVTNTRFSPDSQAYSKCAGIQLMGWDYPEGHSLKELAEKHRVFPISILVNLTAKEKPILLERKIVTCHQLLNYMDQLEELGMSRARQFKLRKEIEELLR